MAPARAPTSAIPTFYYVFFGIYEPILTVTGFLGAMADPKKVRYFPFFSIFITSYKCTMYSLPCTRNSLDARRPSALALRQSASGALAARKPRYRCPARTRLRAHRRRQRLRAQRRAAAPRARARASGKDRRRAAHAARHRGRPARSSDAVGAGGRLLGAGEVESAVVDYFTAWVDAACAAGDVASGDMAVC